MQFSAQIVVGWFGELFGCALILGAVGLAADTLGLRMPATGIIDYLGRLRRLAGTVAAHDAAARVAPTFELEPRTMDAASEEPDPWRLAMIADFHARAMEELEA